MSYITWISGIYSMEDAFFKYFEQQHHIRQLQGIIQRELGHRYLWDEDGEYKLKFDDEYEGFKRSDLTEENER